LLGQFLDWDPAIAQNAFFAINKSDGAFAGTGVPVAAIERDQTGLIA
jgi:hypothetical protein